MTKSCVTVGGATQESAFQDPRFTGEYQSPTGTQAISESKPFLRLHLHSTEAAGRQIAQQGCRNCHGFEVCSHTCVGSSGGSAVKHPPAMQETIYDSGDASSTPGSGRFPWRREWQPAPVFLPEKSHGQRSRWATVHGVTVRHDLATKPAHTHTHPAVFLGSVGGTMTHSFAHIRSFPNITSASSHPNSPLPGALQERTSLWGRHCSTRQYNER